MAWIRQLDRNSAGIALWAATVYLPTGERVTESNINKKIIEAWSKALESSFIQGNWIDPRLGKRTFAELWTLYGEGRRLEKASHKRDASHYKNWVEPTWGKRQIGSILKPDVTAWVVKMEGDGVGGWTVIAALNVLRSLLEVAVDARMIPFNPARGVSTKPPPKHIDRLLTDEECDLLLANLYARFPGRPEAGLMCEVMAYCGPRYEEIAALRRTPEAVIARHKLIHVRRVMEKDGTERDYPKSAAGDRDLPVDDDLWPRLWEHIQTVPVGGRIFPAPGGGPLLYDNWLKRTWKRGLVVERPMTELEVEEWKAKRVADGKRPWKVKWVIEEPVLENPQPTPHDLRHLYGTRLAEANLPDHERMALLGHDDIRALARYSNPRHERFDRARAAMRRRPKAGE